MTSSPLVPFPANHQTITSVIVTMRCPVDPRGTAARLTFMSTPESSQSAAGRRQADARRRIELSQAAARHEAVAAQKLIDEFVAEATRRGISPEPLRATLMSGPVVKTDKQGWYLRRNRSLAIGTDGSYYVMTVPGGTMARWRGVSLTPTPPTLQIGRGGRDGETGELTEFLAWRLEAGNDFN